MIPGAMAEAAVGTALKLPVPNGSKPERSLDTTPSDELTAAGDAVGGRAVFELVFVEEVTGMIDGARPIRSAPSVLTIGRRRRPEPVGLAGAVGSPVFGKEKFDVTSSAVVVFLTVIPVR